MPAFDVEEQEMQEKLRSPNHSTVTNLFSTSTRRSSDRVLSDMIIATLCTILLGIPLFTGFLLLVYYELYLHGIQADFSLFHILGKVVPLHLATLLLWSAIFWTAVFAVRRFLTQRKQLANTQEWLSHSHTQALTDALTGIWNRRGFDVILETGFQQAVNLELPYTLLLVDINQFKQYNDTYGHWAGDQALQQVARLLVDGVRTEDSVARYGGDEFAILCPGLGWGDAMALVHRLQAACLEKTPVTLSIGAAVFPLDADCGINLIQTADKRLYEAKNRRPLVNAPTFLLAGRTPRDNQSRKFLHGRLAITYQLHRNRE